MADPVLVLGTHRSGTSLVNRLLESAGLFVGKDLEENHESEAFIALNRAVFRQASAKWNEPRRAAEVLEDPLAREMYTAFFDEALGGRRMRGYMGTAAFARHRDPRRWDRPWGWKDPRTSITLPLWLELFPDAQLLRVRRHGVDVASSLHHRYRKRRAACEASFRRGEQKGRPDLPYTGVDTMERAFQMWLDSEQVLDAHLVGRDVHTVRYEDLLADPVAVMATVTDALGLGAVPQRLLGTIRDDRAFAYRRHPKMVAFADAHADELAKHAY